MNHRSRSPNVLFIVTDQQRFDTIGALGNSHIHTPNLDRLVARGAVCEHAYSPCPVCVPARYAIRTGRDPLTTGYFQNEPPILAEGYPAVTEERCGEFLARAMRRRGYRTFGIGKFHTIPVKEDLGYDVYQRCEEMDGYPDSYAQFIWAHPAYRHIEQLHGERTEMYYQPQMSPLPAELTAERWATDRAIEQITKVDDRPYFGVLSFVGPHPPFAPPVPFNRMYDPDRMRDPIVGPESVDLMDPRVEWNRYFVFAEDLSNAHIRTLRARYYGEISYIDSCVGRVIDTIEQRSDADDTLIVFTSDHGEFLGDHRAVQKENFFEESAHVSMLVSLPTRIKPGTRIAQTVMLTDLFGLATSAASSPELRDGIDLMALLEGRPASTPRTRFGFSSAPGSLHFRMMALTNTWKYVFHANGGGELLFDPVHDPHEHRNLIVDRPDMAKAARAACVDRLRNAAGAAALDGERLRCFPKTRLPQERIYQMNAFRGVVGFPEHPDEVVFADPTGCDTPQ